MKEQRGAFNHQVVCFSPILSSIEILVDSDDRLRHSRRSIRSGQGAHLGALRITATTSSGESHLLFRSLMLMLKRC